MFACSAHLIDFKIFLPSAATSYRRKGDPAALLHVALITRIQQPLPIYEKFLGDHPFTATTLNCIGESHHTLGNYSEAIEFTYRALKIREALLGRHQETAQSHFHLGKALSAKGELEQALKHLRAAADMQEQVLDTHEETVMSHSEIATVLEVLGRKEEAEKEMKRVEEFSRKLQSPLDGILSKSTVRSSDTEKGWQMVDYSPSSPLT